MTSIEFYQSDRYHQENPDWHEADSPWKAAQILAMLRRFSYHPDTVADVGCGVGAIVECLARDWPARYFGFDVAQQAIERAQDRHIPSAVFYARDAFEAGIRFDLAMAIDVFEHVEDPFRFLRSMRRISSRQLYHIPLDLSVSTVLRRRALPATRSHLGHLHHYTAETALALLRDTGHQVIDLRYTSAATDLVAKHPTVKKRLALLPRRWGRAVSPSWTARMMGGFSLLVLCD